MDFNLTNLQVHVVSVEDRSALETSTKRYQLETERSLALDLCVLVRVPTDVKHVTHVLVPPPLPPLAHLIISSLPAATKLNFACHHTTPPSYLLPLPPSIDLVTLTFLPLRSFKNPHHCPITTLKTKRLPKVSLAEAPIARCPRQPSRFVFHLAGSDTSPDEASLGLKKC